jgi:hypothetical protein
MALSKYREKGYSEDMVTPSLSRPSLFGSD